jgi:spore germination cell wall hydrolase CwlJ-like protein
MPFVDPVTCLALAIYWEARNQPVEGQLAVAQTVLNRVEDSKFPNDVCAVVTQAIKKRGKVLRNKCQFSFYCDGVSDVPTNEDAYAASLGVAYAAIIIRDVDITGGALYYHATYASPYWANAFQPTIKVADHVFYR